MSGRVERVGEASVEMPGEKEPFPLGIAMGKTAAGIAHICQCDTEDEILARAKRRDESRRGRHECLRHARFPARMQKLRSQAIRLSGYFPASAISSTAPPTSSMRSRRSLRACTAFSGISKRATSIRSIVWWGGTLVRILSVSLYFCPSAG